MYVQIYLPYFVVPAPLFKLENTKQVISRAPRRFRSSEYTHFEGNAALRVSRGVWIGQNDDF